MGEAVRSSSSFSMRKRKQATRTPISGVSNDAQLQASQEGSPQPLSVQECFAATAQSGIDEAKRQTDSQNLAQARLNSEHHRRN
jgi:hypothetical protein